MVKAFAEMSQKISISQDGRREGGRGWIGEGGEGGTEGGGEEGGGGRRLRWKEADKLESFGMGAIAGNAVVFGDGFVECG